MGDRANVYVKGHNDDPGVYLYTHWSGTELPAIVHAALARSEDRWTDGPYLTRIVFSEMIRDNVEGTTGFGISGGVCDGGNRVITLDPNLGEVSLNGVTLPFKEFVALAEVDWHLRPVVNPIAPMSKEQRRALFSAFTDVFGSAERPQRIAFTAMALGKDARFVPISWSSDKPGALTVSEASKVLDALDALDV